MKLSANMFSKEKRLTKQSSKIFVNRFADASTSALKPSPNSIFSAQSTTDAIFAPVACLTYSQKIRKGNKCVEIAE